MDFRPVLLKARYAKQSGYSKPSALLVFAHRHGSVGAIGLDEALFRLLFGDIAKHEL